MCFVCLSLCESGQGYNRLGFRGARVWCGGKGVDKLFGEVRGGGGGVDGEVLEGEVIGERGGGGRGSWGSGGDR